MEERDSFGGPPLFYLKIKKFSIVFRTKFKEGLRMVAYGTLLGCALAYMDMATFETHPHTVTVAGEYKTVLDILEKCAVTLHMGAFDLTNHLKFLCNLGEAFLASDLCETHIHVVPLIFLSSSCIHEVLGSCRYVSAMKILEP